MCLQGIIYSALTREGLSQKPGVSPVIVAVAAEELVASFRAVARASG